MFSWLKSHAFGSLAANGRPSFICSSASFYFFDLRIHVINIMVKII